MLARSKYFSSQAAVVIAKSVKSSHFYKCLQCYFFHLILFCYVNGRLLIVYYICDCEYFLLSFTQYFLRIYQVMYSDDSYVVFFMMFLLKFDQNATF